MEEFDVIVVGAGIAGLSAAKTYLQCASDTNLAILDNNHSIGGVWSRERIYPDLLTNNIIGTYELPEFPMHTGFGVKPGEHIPGLTMHKYLCEYADHFDLTRRIKLGVDVIQVEKIDLERPDTGWKLTTDAKEHFTCKKLIMCTGFTSQPIETHVKGEESFNSPIIRSKELAHQAPLIFEQTPDDRKQIAVIGGSKSSYDMVWMFANRGFKVDWVIRDKGFGPAPLLPSYLNLGPLSLRVELLTATRAISWLSPCLWSNATGMGWVWNLLHGTNIGRSFIDVNWKILEFLAFRQTGVSQDPELQKLLPNASHFWYGSKTAIMNYPSPGIYSFIKSGQVKVHKDDVSHLSSGTLHLKSGTEVSCPAGIALATTWNTVPNAVFSQKELHSDLGLPSIHYFDQDAKHMHALDARADEEIFTRLPVLRDAPVPNVPQPLPLPGANATLDLEGDGKLVRTSNTHSAEPMRLYRFMAPPGLTIRGDRSIVFGSLVSNIQNCLRIHAQSLWAYAYLNRKLDSLDYQDAETSTTEDAGNRLNLEYEAALWNRFTRHRSIYGYGHKLPDFVFEQIPYCDVLLQDLGLRCLRKGSWRREIGEPYGPDDYKGLVDEWLGLQETNKDNKKEK